MSKTKATTKRAKSARAQRKQTSIAEILKVLSEVEPKVRGLWGLSSEQDRQMRYHESVIDRIMDMLRGQVSTENIMLSMLRDMNERIDQRIRMHELTAHGRLLSINEAEQTTNEDTPSKDSARARAEKRGLRVLQGEGSSTMTHAQNDRRPQLHLVTGGLGCD